MPRYARMIVKGEKAVYHMMSRTALDGYPFDEFGYCIMGNHFHLLTIE